MLELIAKMSKFFAALLIMFFTSFT